MKTKKNIKITMLKLKSIFYKRNNYFKNYEEFKRLKMRVTYFIYILAK